MRQRDYCSPAATTISSRSGSSRVRHVATWLGIGTVLKQGWVRFHHLSQLALGNDRIHCAVRFISGYSVAVLWSRNNFFQLWLQIHFFYLLIFHLFLAGLEPQELHAVQGSLCNTVHIFLSGLEPQELHAVQGSLGNTVHIFLSGLEPQELHAVRLSLQLHLPAHPHRHLLHSGYIMEEG